VRRGYVAEYRSTDAGQTWAHVGGKGFPPHAWVYALWIVSSSYPGPAYTAREHVYRTTEGGSTWQVWDGGDLPDEDRITNLAGYLP
jgi:photosystem II stability/assembly factor-like uncharacterized protein